MSQCHKFPFGFHLLEAAEKKLPEAAAVDPAGRGDLAHRVVVVDERQERSPQLLDRLLPARRYTWPRAHPLPRSAWREPVTRPVALPLLALTATVRADPAMWEARDADSRIVLFGSVHMLPRALEWRTPALDAAMARSEHVYFETDVGPRGVLALTVKMTLAMFQSATAPWLDAMGAMGSEP